MSEGRRILLKSVLVIPQKGGEHNSDQSYAKLTQVQHETSIYEAREDIPQGVAITDPRWVCVLDNSAAWEAEQTRENQEQTRQIQEQDRQDERITGVEISGDDLIISRGGKTPLVVTDGMKQMNDAVRAADQATSNANTAAGSVDESKTAANNAAQLANEMAALANQKATLANDKANLANEKAGLAEAKAGLANSAAEDATRAACLVNDKLSNYALMQKAEGNPVSIYPVAESKIDYVVKLQATQEGEGDPAPDNIRTFVPSVVNGGNFKLRATGKNLIDPLTFYSGASRTSNGITYTRQSDGGIKISGTATDTSVYYLKQNNVWRLFPGTYTLSTGSNKAICTMNAGGSGKSVTKTFGENQSGNTYFMIGVASGVIIDEVVYVQLEFGSVATSYEPYTGKEITLTNSTGQDWYGLPGAPVEVREGKVVIGSAFVSFNGTESWSSGNANDHGRVYSTIMPHHRINSETLNVGSHGLSFLGSSNNIDPDLASLTDILGGATDWFYCFVPFDLCTDLNAFKAWLATQAGLGTPLQKVYGLATPITVPAVNLALSGAVALDPYAPLQNIIVSDKGQVEVNYAKVLKIAQGEIRSTISSLVFNPLNYREKITGLTHSGIKAVYLYGDTTGMTKDVAKPMTFSLWDGRNGSVNVKWQGTSSVTYPKKNFTLTLGEGLQIMDAWGVQTKYCFKANFIDFSHARNNVCAKLWSDIILSRSSVPTWVADAPNSGAIDGFPIMLFINDEYVGLYSFNIPKDKWMFGMTGSGTEAVLSAEGYGPITRFSALAECDGSDRDFKIEHSVGMTHTEIKNSINAAISAAINGSSDLWSYLDLGTNIDFVIYLALITGFDLIGKNYLLATFDGVKWYQSAYDLDSTFGNHWAGYSYMEYSNPSISAIDHIAGTLMRNTKTSELKARYVELRKGVMSEEAVYKRFYNYMADIPLSLKNQEAIIWPQTPGTTTNTVDQIVMNYRLRAKLIDAQVDAL